MKTARSTTLRPDGQALPACVLHWVPGYVTSAGCGMWELEDAAAYAGGAPAAACPVSAAPRGTPPAALALWAAGQLGFPVELEPAAAVAGEPRYYVRAAKTARRGAGAAR